MPSMGESTMAESVSIHLLPQMSAPNPRLGHGRAGDSRRSARATSSTACPYHQVNRFQMIAPSRPAQMTHGSTKLCTTKPLLTAFATAVLPKNAAAKLKNAAQRTAATGLSTRVPTIVAMEFAESWNPLMKSKMNAIPMIARTKVITVSCS